MVNKFALVFSLLIFSCIIYPQNNYKLSGGVVDSEIGTALPGANVTVISRIDGKILAQTTCDAKGYFTASNIAESTVRAKFSMLGYQTFVIDSIPLEKTYRLGIIKLRSTMIVMPEAVVSTVKPMIEFQVDRQIINMDQVPGSSGSLTDALKNTGSVDVDPQTNAITVRGQAVKIQMDGHPFEMPNDMLAQLPASMVDQVEVILSPSAKESADEGAYILNIISKKGNPDSYSGSINLNTSTNSRTFGGLNLNYKTGKFNLFGAFFGGFADMLNTSASEKYNYNSANLYYLNTDNKGNFNGNMGYYKFGFDYNMDDNNSFTFYSTMTRFKFNSGGTSQSVAENNLLIPQYSYDNTNNSLYRSNTYSLYGFYKKKFDARGHEITFDAYFTNIANPSNSEMNTAYSYNLNYPQLHNSVTDEKANTFISKIEYVIPSSIGKFETGYNLTLRTRENDYNSSDFSYAINNWTDSLRLSNLFSYKESIHALYATYSNNFGNVGIKTGLRVENLNTNGEQKTTGENFTGNYLNFFPNINLSYKFNDLFQLTFNAFRRVRYPQMYYVNPFKTYNGPNNYTAGNPAIKPSFINSYAVTLSQYVNVYYVYSTGLFDYVMANVNDSITFNSPVNLSSNKTYGVELTLPYYNSPMMPFYLPDFISMVNVQIGYTYQKKIGSYLGEDLSDWGYRKWMNVNLGLKLWWEVDANFNFRYSPKTESKKYVSNRQTDLSVYLSKSVWDKKLKINLSVSDLLNTNNYDRKTFGTDFFYHTVYTPYRSRSVSLGLTYMINDYKDRRDRSLDDGRDASNQGF
ncbi:MAG: outer membrane beta-barrel family protein [Ignavibacteria bacterium]|nr:outer membrane beta-barrel family protein [Ignavibacteria bacterium]